MNGAPEAGEEAGGRAWLLVAAGCALPLLAVGYQVAARQTADVLGNLPFGWAWLYKAARTPWMHALVLIEAASFVTWMLVLARMQLAAAFPFTALSYVLVIAASWGVFGEPGHVLQVMGSAAILVGVWLIARRPQPGI